MGYKNLNKGFRHLDDLLSNGEYKEEFLKKCIKALSLDNDVIARAIEKDNQARKSAIEKMERDSFKPYIYKKTRQTRPSSITMFAFTGGVMQHKAFYIPENIIRESRSDEEFQEIGNLVREHFHDSDGIAPFFGEITSYLYCPAYDESYEFSTDGVLLSENLGKLTLPIATVRIG